MKKFYFLLSISFLLSNDEPQYIDGVVAVIEDHIVLKSDLAQMVNMAAVQSGLDPQKDPTSFLRLQGSVLQSMIDQKILLDNLLDINQWVQDAVTGKINHSWKSMNREWINKLMNDKAHLLEILKKGEKC